MEEKERDTRSRKWQLTVNNPLDHECSHTQIQDKVSDMKSCCYWCMCDEIGENGTYHTHIFLAFNDAMRYSTLKKKFFSAHMEMAKGTSVQNRDYIRKEGKWENSKKKETNLIDTFEEFGSMPMERQGQRNDITDLYDMVKQGMTDFEILENNPVYLLQIEKVDRARQIIKENQYRKEFRNLEVTYLYGDAGCGKTRSIMEEYGYENVYRVTDYKHPFDSYKGQDIIIFEEFRSSLRIEQMLNYLDGYPVELPCRYANKIACFTKVYLITNVELEEQYKQVQREYHETWKAFLRRINCVTQYIENEVKHFQSVPEYLEQFRRISESPFDRNKNSSV